MSEQQQLTEEYAKQLISSGKIIQQWNELGKEELIKGLVEKVQSASSNLIKLLEFDEKVTA
tara:strand:- start:281 stop:463 length:183 start_codon:yes stop_codon:yes gene_type:complete